MTRDEFGGYCCKRYGSLSAQKEEEEKASEENICALLGLDINRKAFGLVQQDFIRRNLKEIVHP